MSHESIHSHPLPAGLVGVAVDFDPFAADPAAAAIEQVITPTDAQREVWLADHLGREASLAYNEAVELDLRGPLDDAAVTRLQGACQAVYRAHQALRAVFSDDGAEMLVQPADAAPLVFDVVDLRMQDESTRNRRLADWRQQVVTAPFDLCKGPLFRAHLLRLTEQHGVLLLAAHHLVCDGYSFGIVLRDLARAMRGEPLASSAYADYAADEARFAQSAEAGANVHFWTGRYAKDVPVTDLPTDHSRPARRQVAANRIDHLIPAADFERLQQAARSLRISLFSLLLGGFELLMSRLTGSADVVVGVPAAGQVAAELPDIVGHCVNLLPVRGRIDTEVTAADWLAGVQRELLDAFDHQRFTFGTLLRHLALRRDPSRLPLVSVMFNLDQRLDPALTALPGFDTTIHPVARRFENFELFFNLTPLDTGLRIECQFSTALFDDASIQQWLQSYAALLTGIAQDPQRLVGHLPALDADQKAQLARWNRTEHEQGLGRTPVALLDRIGITQPRKVALADARHQLSYRALLDASHQLALRLQEYGVGPDSRVGLCLTRGVAMVVAQWAVWRTGAAYVPLDPHFPQDRLSYMAEDAGLALVMADAETVEVCQQFGWPAERTLTISADDLIRDLPASGEIEKRLDLSRPEAAAYVIYTSGSTGKPKGVAVPHRAAANLLLSMQRKPGIRASDRLLAVTTLSFDIALLELITPLIAGGTVHVADRDDTGDGHRLAERLQQWNITVMQATPGTWRLLLAADWQPTEGFRALVGGEPLPLDLARDLTALPLTLWNMYGPTETTVWSTCWQVPPQPSYIRIGGPIDNTRIHIVDAHGQEVPVGAAGEIIIAGEGVALGYLNRPELTEDRFIPDDFVKNNSEQNQPARIDGRRAYRTGDSGRWHHDGTLEHLGRLDHQVKVRGYRIELGEIESVLSTFEGITQVVTIVREDVPGDQRLVAYMVVDDPEAAPREANREEASALRSHLRKQLPDYMVPQHFVWLPTFTLLPNGKIDRKALPRPDQLARSIPNRHASTVMPGSSGTARGATPRTPATASSLIQNVGADAVSAGMTTASSGETMRVTGSATGATPASTDATPSAAPVPALLPRVQALMAEYLRLPEVAADDDFFAVGGHSLLAAQLLQALGRELGRKIPLATLFESPTPLQLAAWLEKGEGHQPVHTTDQPAFLAASHAPAAEPADTIARRADRSVAPLSLMQQRLYFLESINPDTPVYNTPSAHRLTGKLNEYAFQRAFNQLMQRQPILRTIIDTDAQGMPEQRVVDNLQVSLFPAMDLSKLQGQDQEAALRHAIDSLAQEPIPLHGAPLFRTRMFRLADEQHVWFFMPHHIIWDGWSFDLLYQEMAALYAHQMEKPGAADPLPPLAIDYGDFAGWHHQFLKSDTLQKQVDHWLSIIDPKLPPLDVPADRKRPARMSGLGSTEWLYLPEPLVARLREHARQQHTTPFMTLLAVWALLLHGLSRQPTLRIGTPVRGRELPELEQVMGFFVNALPLTFHFGTDQASDRDATHASPTSATPAGMAAGAGVREHAPRTISQLLEQVRQTVVTAFGNSDVPADRILQAMGPSRDESRPPLWQAFFSFQEATARQLQWGNLHDKPLYVLQPGTAEDLGLWFLANGNHLVGGLQYNTDIFDALRVRRIAEAYQLLLTCWLDSKPDTPLADMLTHIPTAVLCGVDHPVTALPSTPTAAPQAGSAQPSSASPTHQPGFGEEIGIEKVMARTAPTGNAPSRDGTGTEHAVAHEVTAPAHASAAADTPAAMPTTVAASAAAPGAGVQAQVAPSSDAAGHDVATAEAPRPAEDADSMEATLTGVWADLLGTDDIRPDDNFFDLGGHSMLVMQAIARMEVLTGRRVNPRRFVFETLAQVAHAYEEAQSGPAPEADTAGRKGGLMARMLGGLRKRH